MLSFFDITSLSLSIPIIIFAFASYKYEFMDIVPSAMKKIIDSTGDGIIVIDLKNRILFWNNMVLNLFNNQIIIRKNMYISEVTDQIGQQFTEVIKPLIHLDNDDIEVKKTEFLITDKTLSLRTHPILSSNTEILGRIIVLADVTEYKVIQQKLKDYADVSRQLAIEKERIRMTRDMHDTIGHSMTSLISLLEVAKIKMTIDSKDALEKLEQAISTAKEGITEIRRSVSGLKKEDFASLSIKQTIQNLIEKFKNSEVKIDFSCNGIEELVSNDVSEVLISKLTAKHKAQIY